MSVMTNSQNNEIKFHSKIHLASAGTAVFSIFSVDRDNESCRAVLGTSKERDNDAVAVCNHPEVIQRARMERKYEIVVEFLSVHHESRTDRHLNQ